MSNQEDLNSSMTINSNSVIRAGLPKVYLIGAATVNLLSGLNSRFLGLHHLQVKKDLSFAGNFG